MDLTPEQLKQIRKQLLEQVNTTFPEEKKAETIQQIENMNDSELIQFLKENNLIKNPSTPESQQGQCIFCSIVYGDIPSTKIGENEKAISILELNPASKGHALIIPKEHIPNRNDLPQEVYDLAKEIGEKIKPAFKPKEIKVLEGEVMGHQIINLLPVYSNETLDSERIKQTPEQLLDLKKQIDSSPEQIEMPENHSETNSIPEKTPPKTEVLTEKDTWLPRRKP